MQRRDANVNVDIQYVFTLRSHRSQFIHMNWNDAHGIQFRNFMRQTCVQPPVCDANAYSRICDAYNRSHLEIYTPPAQRGVADGRLMPNA